MLSKILYYIVSFILSLIIIECGIRVICPQSTDAILYEDIFTTDRSISLNNNVKSLVPNISRVKSGIEYRINSNGFRDFIYEKIKRRNTYRIAIIGSSVNFGFNVTLENTFGKQLEKFLNKNNLNNERYEVLLFGRPGFNTKDSYGCLVDKVFSYNPDLIIHSIVQNNLEKKSFNDYFSKNENDISKSNVVNRSLINWHDLKNTKLGKKIRSQVHLYLFSAASINNIYNEVLISNGLKEKSTIIIDSTNADFSNKLHNSISWISQMNKECILRNVSFSLVIHPFEMQLNKNGLNKWRKLGYELNENILELHYHKIIKDFCESNKIYFFDIIKFLTNNNIENTKLFLENDFGHYSLDGHQVVASIMNYEILNNFQK